MAAVTVDELQIRVSGSSTNAAASINALIMELERLQGFRLNDSVAQSINNIGKAASNAAKKASKMASEFEKAMSSMNAMTVKNFGWQYGNSNTGLVQTAQPLQEYDRGYNSMFDGVPQIGMDNVIDTSFYEIPTVAQDVADETAGEVAGAASEVSSSANAAASATKNATSSANEAAKATSKVASASKEAASAADETTKKVSAMGSAFHTAVGKIGTLISSFARIVKYRVIRSIIKSITSAFSEGTNNIYQYSKAIGGVFSQNMDSCASALATFKNSIGAAVAPIISALTPALVSVCTAATNAANAIARFIAIMGGKSTYTKAIAYTKEYASATEKAAGSASNALKEMTTGIDELNVLSDSASGGGSGSSSTPDYSSMFEETGVGKISDFLSSLKLTFDDVFIEWKDLDAEKILEKIIVGLCALAGGIAGFMITGSFGGALLGIIIGAALGLAIDSVIFNHDGKVSGEELAQVIITGVLGLLGGVAGFMIGGVKGAALGFAIGAALSLVINAVTFDHDDELSKGEIENAIMTFAVGALGAVAGGLLGGLPGAIIGFTVGAGLIVTLNAIELAHEQSVIDEFYTTTTGEIAEKLKEKGETSNQLAIDLKARISSITGEIDAETQTNLEMAKDLINDIFTIDASENLTAGEIAVIKEKIEELNGLGLEGIQLSFDETTGHVQQTRAEIEQVLEKLQEQYKLEAMREAYIEAYKAQTEAELGLKDAVDQTNESFDLWHNQTLKVKDAQEELATAQQKVADYIDEWDKKTGEGGDTNYLYEESYQKLAAAVEEASTKLGDAKIVQEELKDVYDENHTAMEALEDDFDSASEKVDYFNEKITGLVTGMDDQANDVMTGFGDGLLKHGEYAADQMTAACDAILQAEKDYNQIGSPSVLYEDEGGFIMEGLKNGIKDGEVNVVTPAMKTALQNLLTATQTDLGTLEGTASTVYKTEGTNIMQGMADGITENAGLVTTAFENVMTSLKTLMENTMNSLRTMLNDMLSDFQAEFASVDVDEGGMDYSPSSLRAYASGGVVDSGQMFIARENGAELVGSIGNSTAVMNNDQIVAAVSQGVYDATVSALSQSKGSDNSIYVYLDGKQIEASTRTTKQRRGATIANGGVINYA